MKYLPYVIESPNYRRTYGFATHTGGMEWGTFGEGDVLLDSVPIFKHLKDYKDGIINKDPDSLTDRDRQLWEKVAQLVRTDKTMEYVLLLQDIWKGVFPKPRMVVPKRSSPPRSRVPKQCFYCKGYHIRFTGIAFVCGNQKCATVLDEGNAYNDEVDVVDRCGGGTLAPLSTRDRLVAEFRRAERHEFTIYEIGCMEQLVDHFLLTRSESFVSRNQQSIKLGARVFTALVMWARFNMVIVRGKPTYQQVTKPKPKPVAKPQQEFDYDEYARKESERIRNEHKRQKLV